MLTLTWIKTELLIENWVCTSTKQTFWCAEQYYTIPICWLSLSSWQFICVWLHMQEVTCSDWSSQTLAWHSVLHSDTVVRITEWVSDLVNSLHWHLKHSCDWDQGIPLSVSASFVIKLPLHTHARTRAHTCTHTQTHTHTQIHSNAFMQHRMSQHQRDPAPGSQIIQSSCGLIIETSGVDSIFFTAVPHHRTATRDACLCIPKTSHADVLS